MTALLTRTNTELASSELASLPDGYRRATKTAAAGPELRVVAPAQRRRPAGLAVAVAVLVMFGALFLNAVFHSVLVSGQANLDGLNRRADQAETANQQRRLSVAQLESPERIVDAASASGMVLPERTYWIMPQPTAGDTPPPNAGAIDAPASNKDGSQLAAGPAGNDRPSR